MAQYGTYSLGEIAAQVKAADAKRFSRASTPIAIQDELTRYWRVDNHLMERVRAFLDKYGDGDQLAEGENPPEVHAIVSPLVDHGVSQPGTWRVVRNFEDPEMPGTILQTMRLGWITSLVSGEAGSETIDWSEARNEQRTIGSSVPYPADAGSVSSRVDMVPIVWYGVDPTKARAIAGSLSALAPDHSCWDSAAVRSEALGSGYRRVGGARWRVMEDGSGMVSVLLAKSEQAFDTFSDYNGDQHVSETTLYGVPAELVNAYAAAWRRYGAQSAAGSPPDHGSVSASVNTEQGLAVMRFRGAPAPPAKGAVVIGAYRDNDEWSLHFIAWSQPISNMAFTSANPIGFSDANRISLGGDTNWMVNVGNITAAMVTAGNWRLSGFNHDRRWDRLSWHAVWSPDKGYIEEFSTYTWQTVSHRFWDTDLLLWRNMAQDFQWKHHVKTFNTLQEAIDWRTEGGFQRWQSSPPRMVGRRYQSEKVTMQYRSPFYEPSVHDTELGAPIPPIPLV